jgi:hypothetical protein
MASVTQAELNEKSRIRPPKKKHAKKNRQLFFMPTNRIEVCPYCKREIDKKRDETVRVDMRLIHKHC